MARQYIEAVPSTRLHLPSLCAVCRGWGVQRLCTECETRHAAPVPRCERCALQVPAGQPVCGACIAHPPPQDATVAALAYGHPWDGWMRDFKFHGALDLAPALSRLMADALQRAAAPLPDLLLPLPLSEARLRERGYNQAWELTRRLARRLGCRADAHLLLRIRDTPHQLALPRDERGANVRGAFAVEPRRRAEMTGRHVALVDDVMTTGATVAEAARVLKQAGAARVSVWVAARTPRPGED